MSYGDNAYIYLRKKILDWQWYSDTPTRSVFIHCLLRASWKETEYKGIRYGRGQLIDSNATIAKDLGISIQNVKTAITHLKESGELTSLKIGRTRIITVVKYDLYQQTNLSTNPMITSNQPQTNLELTSYKEVKEEKEVKEVKKELSNDNSISCQTHHKRIVDKWNTLKDYGVPTLRSITPNSNRERSLKARLKEFGEDSFDEIIEHFKKSKFLQGKATSFKPGFDWVITPTYYSAILEGKYDDDRHEKKQDSFSAEDIMQMFKKEG